MKQNPWISIGGFGVFLVALVLLNTSYYENQKNESLHAVGEQLRAVADLKVREMSLWHRARIGRAEAIMNNPIVSGTLEKYITDQNPSRRKSLEAYFAGLKKGENADFAGLFDAKGIPVIELTDTGHGIHFNDRERISLSLKRKSLIISDLYRRADEGRAHIDIIIPLLKTDVPGTPASHAIVLRFDPFIDEWAFGSQWPTPSRTAEAILVRREGDSVVFLNELRHRANTTLNLRFAAAATELPAARAVRGERGMMRGVDYRNEPVLAYAMPVEGNSWFLIAKIDLAEVLDPLITKAWFMGALSFLILAVAGTILLLVARHRRGRLYEELYEVEREKGALKSHYEYLTKYANDMILLSNEEGRVVEANERAVTMSGFALEELVQMAIDRLLLPENGAAGRLARKEGEDGILYTAKLRHKESGFVEVEVSSRIIEIDGKKFQQSIIRDIAERREAERYIRHQANLIDNVGDAIMSADLRFVITSWNTGAERIYGWTAEEAIGKLFHELVNPDYGDVTREEVVAEYTKSRTWRGRVVHGTKTGRRICVQSSVSTVYDEHGGAVGNVAVNRDITEQVAMEEQAKQAQADLRLLMENSVSGIAVHEIVLDQNGNPVDYVFLSANSVFERMTGLSVGQILGRRVTEIIPGIEQGPFIGVYGKVALTGEPVSFEQYAEPLKRHYHINAYRVSERRFATVFEDITERKKTEQAIRESADRFKNVVEGTEAGYFRIGLEGRFESVNKAWLHMHGYDAAEEIIGQHFSTTQTGQDYAQAESIVESVLHGEVIPAGEFSRRCKDGSVGYHSFSVYPVRKDNIVVGLEGFLIDTTEQKRADAALRLQEEKIRSIFRAAPVGIGMIVERVFQEVNDTLCEMTGYTRYELLHRSALMLYPNAEEFQRVEREKYGLIHQSGTGVVDTTWKRKDGRLIQIILSSTPLDFSNFSSGLTFTALDVTDRREMEKALVRSEERYRLLLENANDGVITHDISPEGPGKFLSVNERFCKMLGYTAGELLELTVDVIDVPDQAERMPGIIANLYATGSAVFDTQLVAKDGRRVPVEVSARLFELHGRPTVLSVIRDSTERIQHVRLLKESEEEYRALFNEAPVAYHEIDTEGRILRVNQTELQMLRYTREEMLGKYIWEFVTDPESSRFSISEKVSGRRPPTTNYERTFVRSDGGHVPTILEDKFLYAPDGSISGIRTVVQDITERKRNELALMQSEERYRRLVEMSPYPIMVHADGRFKYLNKAGLDVLGAHTLEEILDKPIMEVVHPEYRAVVEDRVSRINAEGVNVPMLREKFIRLDGRIIDVEVTAMPMTFAGKSAVLVVVVDITDRKKIEDANIREDKRLRSLLKITQQKTETIQEFLDYALEEAIAITESRIGFLLHYSEQKRQFVPNSWSGEAMAECRVREPELTYDLDKTGLWGEVVRQRRPIIVNDYQSPHPLKKGVPEGHVGLKRFLSVPVIIDGQIVGVVGVANKESDYEIEDAQQLTLLMSSVWQSTERKKAEEALRRSQRDLARAQTIAGFGSWQYDPKTRLFECSEELRKICSFPPGDVTFEDFIDAVDPLQRELVAGSIEHCISKRSNYTIEYALAGQNGHRRTVRASGEPMFDDHGSLLLVVGVVQDITERKKAEEAFREAQKMESLGLLAGGVAHDFNNLLQAILGNTALASRRLAQDHAAYPNVKRAESAAEQAAHITRQLLAYSGRGKVETKVVDLNELIRKNTHLLDVIIPKNVRFVMDLSQEAAATFGDEGQLQQVIMNIIINGSEAIGSRQGTLTCITRVIEITKDDRMEWLMTDESSLPGRYALIDIQDDGCGMSEDTLKKIFDPFFTTKRAGRGLGLPAVVGIIRGHRGGLRVRSTVGQGTIFQVALPAIHPIGEAGSCSNPSAEGAPLDGAILIIDDEESVREVVIETLEENNQRVLAAADGSAGVDMFKAHKEEIGLVLLDLSMPGMGGEETFRRLKEVDPTVRVVLTSGYAEEEALERFAGQGITGFIQKPYKWSQLMQTIRELLSSGSEKG